jgi:CBS domain-containing protein
MSAIPKELQEASAALRRGNERVDVPVRTLVKWFKAERRGPWIITYIRAALRELGLRTEPDFSSVNIDAVVSLLPQASNIDETVEEPSAMPDLPLPEERPRISGQDPTLRIRILRAAITKPTCVNENDPIDKAVTIMLANEFSQLPVMRGEHVRGAVSWRSIGKRLSLGSKAQGVNDCLENPLELRGDTSLLSAIAQIVKSDYALIKDHTGRLSGLVTTADLSSEFGTLSEPFLLLREIESYLRALLEPVCTPKTLEALKDPSSKRKPASVADLTFGEYTRAFQDPSIWETLGLRIDKRTFGKWLEEARQIRNEVMHFDPDPIEAARVEALRSIARLLQALAESKIISLGDSKT